MRKRFKENQGELDPAGALDLNDAIFEPAQEALIARISQAAYAEVVELEDDTDDDVVVLMSNKVYTVYAVSKARKTS